MDIAVLCETIMLITFGCSWPFNIAKSLKSKTTLGKSLYFRNYKIDKEMGRI